MQDLNSIRIKVVSMSGIALKMLKMTFQTFMEHDLDLLSKALEEENKLNNLEKEITTELVEFIRQIPQKEEKSRAVVYADVVGDLEIIGDYCKDILERVQIKIEEKLLFSDEAVKEYGDLYHKTEDAVNEIILALERDKLSLAKEVLKDERRIDSLVDEYRRRHNQRMIEGICSPMACNMFLNMLDFTAQIFHHTKAIAKNMLKLK